jgi:O-antigen ligase
MRSLFLMDDQATQLTKKEKILYALIVLFIITFYLPGIPVVNNIVIGGIALFWFFYNSFSEKLNLLRRRKEVILMVLFYVQHIISALLSNNQQEGFSWVIIRLPLLAFPVTIGLMYISQPLKERIIYAWAVITTITAFACIVWALKRYFSTDDASLLYNDNLTDLIDKQSVYVALMVNLAIFCYGYLLSIQSTLGSLVSKRAFVYTGIFVLLVANFLMASRINITILYSSIFCYTVWYAIKKKRFMPFIGVVAGVGIAWLLLVNFFPKTINRFRELGYTNYEYSHHGVESHFNMEVKGDQWNGANIRLAVWACGWEVVKQHPLLGVQLGDKVDSLMKVYAEKKFDFAYDSRRNMHNNFLDILESFGIVGFVLFLAGFIGMPLFKCVRAKDYFGVAVILAFMLVFVTETYFDRSMGNMVFAFFISLIISYRKEPAV